MSARLEWASMNTAESLSRLCRIMNVCTFLRLHGDLRAMSEHDLGVLREWADQFARAEGGAPLPDEEKWLACYEEALRRAYARYVGVGGPTALFEVIEGGRR